MQDTIFINKLELFTLIGVYDFERTSPQRILIDIEITTDLKLAGETDDLQTTIDYALVANIVDEVAKENSAKLLEHFGENIISKLFSELRCDQINITLIKPDILPNADEVGVILRRRRVS